MTKMDISRLESRDFPFHMAIYPFRPRETIPAHSHEFIEFVYVSEGTGRHDYQGNSYQLRAGDVFVIEPEIEHAYISGADSKLVVYNILFTPSILSQELRSLMNVTSFVGFFYVEPFLRQTARFQSHLNLNPRQQIEMKQLLDRMLEEYEGKQLGYRLLVKTRLIEMLVFMSRCYEQMREQPMASFASELEVMKRIVEFIEMHYASPLTLSQISRLSGMSQSSFTAKFKRYTGKSFVDYRNDIRIDMAKKLLDQTEHTILQIALEVGFEDVSSFNKRFKIIEGVSPGQYRNEMKRGDGRGDG